MKKYIIVTSIGLAGVLAFIYFQSFIWVDECAGWYDCPDGPAPKLK